MNWKEIKISDLVLPDWNPRKISDSGFRKLVDSIRQDPEFLEARPVIASDRTGELVVIAGNMRVRAAQHINNETIPTVVVTLTEEEEKRWSVKDNFHQGEFDYDILANQFSIPMLLDIGMTKLQLGMTIKEDDEVPEIPEEPVSKLGDIFVLGGHRVMCGDSTDKASVERLMDGKKADMVFTDPPYGIDVVGDKGNIGGGTKSAPTTKFRKVIGDDTDFDPTFLLTITDRHFIWGGNYFAHLLPKAGRWFVWDKNRPEGLSLSDCELAWSDIKGVKVQKFKCTWDGYHKEGERGTRVHPNQKPIKLLVDVLNEVSNEGWIVLDLFLGSGSTLIAAEKTGRICFGMELDPKYIDVVVKRYETLTGNKAVKL